MDIQQFTFEPARNFRAMTDEYGIAWFVAKDICEILDISWRGNETLQNIKDEWKGVLDTPTCFSRGSVKNLPFAQTNHKRTSLQIRSQRLLRNFAKLAK